MTATNARVLFLGDFDDPWVGEILESIQRQETVRSLPCANDLPETLYDLGSPPELVIVHRHRLTPDDLGRLEAARNHRTSSSRPTLILCYSNYLRYAELERCTRIFDLLVPEAVAPLTLPHQAARILGGESLDAMTPNGTIPVEFVSTNHDLRTIMVEALRVKGFAASDGSQLRSSQSLETNQSETGLCITVWDVPVLEPDWTSQLARASRLGPVVALIGFADRDQVRQAREAGAVACLDLPLDLDVLTDTLVQAWAACKSDAEAGASVRLEAAHEVPPPPSSRGSRGRAAIRERPQASSIWPEDETPPRIRPNSHG